MIRIPTIEIYFKDKNEELKISAKGFFFASLNYSSNRKLKETFIKWKNRYFKVKEISYTNYNDGIKNETKPN